MCVGEQWSAKHSSEHVKSQPAVSGSDWQQWAWHLSVAVHVDSWQCRGRRQAAGTVLHAGKGRSVLLAYTAHTYTEADQYCLPTLHIHIHRPVSTTCIHRTYIHRGGSVLSAYTSHTYTQVGHYYLPTLHIHAHRPVITTCQAGQYYMPTSMHAAHTHCSVWLEAVIWHWTVKKNCSVCSIRWLLVVPLAGRRLARTSWGQEVQIMETSFNSCMLKCADGCSSRDVEDGLSHDHDGERAAEACHWAGLSTAVS